MYLPLSRYCLWATVQNLKFNRFLTYEANHAYPRGVGSVNPKNSSTRKSSAPRGDTEDSVSILVVVRPRHPNILRSLPHTPFRDARRGPTLAGGRKYIHEAHDSLMT